MNTMADVALLAPVPLEHLDTGLAVCEREGKVAFATEDGMVMAEALQAADAAECPVLFYASKSGSGPPMVTWTGVFAGVGNTPAQVERFRPPSTRTDSPWTFNYLVSNLRKLVPDEVIPITKLRKKSGGKFSATFVPHGPVIIENPF